LSTQESKSDLELYKFNLNPAINQIQTEDGDNSQFTNLNDSNNHKVRKYADLDFSRKILKISKSESQNYQVKSKIPHLSANFNSNQMITQENSSI